MPVFVEVRRFLSAETRVAVSLAIDRALNLSSDSLSAGSRVGFGFLAGFEVVWENGSFREEEVVVTCNLVY